MIVRVLIYGYESKNYVSEETNVHSAHFSLANTQHKRRPVFIGFVMPDISRYHFDLIEYI